MFGVGMAVMVAALAAAPHGTTTPPPTGPDPATSGGVSVTTKATIDLPGVGGHGDVVLADPAAHSVYLSQSPDNNVVILNTDTNTIRAVVGGVPESTGMAYSPSYVFVAESKANMVAVISKDTWRVVATVPSGGENPDAMYYDANKGSLFVGNIDSNNLVELSAKAPFAAQGTLALQPAKGENGEDLGTYVPSIDRIYQSIDNNITVINPNTRTIEKVFTLPIPAKESSKDIFYDRQQNLLWVATTASEVLAINPSTGAVAATVKTTSGIDQVAGDESRQLLFLGEGKAGVMGIVDLNAKKNIADIPTDPTFHTLAYLPGTGDVYAYLNKANKVAVYHVASDTPLGGAATGAGATAAGRDQRLLYGGAATLAAALGLTVLAIRRRDQAGEHHSS
jgi:DNA-binding beta-propeller fold protein YncE